MGAERNISEAWVMLNEERSLFDSRIGEHDAR